jgi:lipopolysaccharide export system permease protein
MPFEHSSLIRHWSFDIHHSRRILGCTSPSAVQIMLRILDRYVLFYYVQTLVICFVSLTGLYVVIDTLTHLDQFTAHADAHGGLLPLLARYYGYRTLDFFERTSAILALIAAIFTVLWLRKHNELTAILAAGIPKLRVLKPVLIASLLVAFVAALNRECILPQVRGELMQDADDLGAGATRELQPCIDAQTGILLGGETTVVTDRSIQNPQFVLPKQLAEHGTRIVGQRGVYQPPSDERPGGYLLSGVSEPRAPASLASVRLEDMPVIITASDAAWLTEDQVFIVSGISFEHLAAGDAWHDYASTAELLRHARSPSVDVAANAHVAVHSRFLRPFLDVTLLFIGLPIVLAWGGRNVFFSIGLCLAVVAAFLAGLVICQFLGESSWTSPALAAWLPLIIFAPAAVALRGAFTS